MGPCERKRSVKSARDRRENADEREREKGRVLWFGVRLGERERDN